MGLAESRYFTLTYMLMLKVQNKYAMMFQIRSKLLPGMIMVQRARDQNPVIRAIRPSLLPSEESAKDSTLNVKGEQIATGNQTIGLQTSHGLFYHQKFQSLRNFMQTVDE